MSENKDQHKKNPGKLIGLYTTSPAAMQRGAILAFVSFIFFFAMLLLFYIRPQIGYFLLSSTFLIVHIITLTGLWMQKKNAVKVYSDGITYKKTTLLWHELISAESAAETDLQLVYKDKDDLKNIVIPRSINNLDNLAGFIQTKIA